MRSKKTMMAAQFVAPGEVRAVETTVPEPERGLTRIRLQRAAICGSDVHWLTDETVGRYPFPAGATGHECVGVVDRTVPDGPKTGTPVLAIPTENLGFAEYMLAPPDKLIPLPEGLDPDAAVVAQQLGTVLFCCKKLPNVVDKNVVVIGQGPAGLMFTHLLYLAGARKVMGIDLIEHRLETARTMGAEATANADHEHIEQSVAAWTQGLMADLVVEAVGKAETFNMAFDLVGRNGSVAIFGVPKTKAMMLNADDMLRKNLRLVTSVDAQSEPNLASFRLGVQLIAEGRFDVRPLISHVLPLAECDRAFRLAETKREGAIKVALNMD